MLSIEVSRRRASKFYDPCCQRVGCKNNRPGRGRAAMRCRRFRDRKSETNVAARQTRGCPSTGWCRVTLTMLKHWRSGRCRARTVAVFDVYSSRDRTKTVASV